MYLIIQNIQSPVIVRDGRGDVNFYSPTDNKRDGELSLYSVKIGTFRVNRVTSIN